MPGRPPPPASPHSANLDSPPSSSCITTTSSPRSPAATSLSDHSSPMSDEDDTVLAPASPSDNPTSTTTPSPPQRTNTDSTPLPPPPLPSTSTRTLSFPVREDCWSEEATHTLIDAWGSHYLELNRGNLRQKHWQEVADSVNALHAHTKKLHRTDIQCKNRIDTLKKKYKVEKSKFIESNGRYVSPWPFFTSLDSLIGDNFLKNAPPSPSPPPPRKHFPAVKSSPSAAPPRKDFLALPPPPSAVPVGPRSKRPAPASTATAEDSFRRNFSAMAAAAAAVVEEEEEEDEESETSTPATVMIRRKKKRRGEDVVMTQGYRQLAEAIGRFGEIYERVEEAKQRQMVELEKQRMQFAKDLEIQRMKLIVDSQVYLAKLKHPKRSSHSGKLLFVSPSMYKCSYFCFHLKLILVLHKLWNLLINSATEDKKTSK